MSHNAGLVYQGGGSRLRRHDEGGRTVSIRAYIRCLSKPPGLLRINPGSHIHLYRAMLV
jgi:hypothetical protein